MKETNIDLLKTELTILSEKINHIVDSLWTIRRFSFALWVAAASVGLGAFASPKTPISEVIFLTHFIPILFLFVDARYQRWYRRFSRREREISKFLNDSHYKLPASGESISVEVGLEGTPPRFPVFDPSGSRTFGRNPAFKWDISLLRSASGSIPMLVYGGQLLGSAVLFTVYSNTAWRWPFVPATVILLVVLAVLRAVGAKRALREGR